MKPCVKLLVLMRALPVGTRCLKESTLLTRPSCCRRCGWGKQGRIRRSECRLLRRRCGGSEGEGDGTGTSAVGVGYYFVFGLSDCESERPSVVNSLWVP